VRRCKYTAAGPKRGVRVGRGVTEGGGGVWGFSPVTPLQLVYWKMKKSLALSGIYTAASS
jgi:hypothetical protein